MRKAIIIGLIVLIITTLFVWGFSRYVQPELPYGINQNIYLIFLALVAVVGLISGVIAIVDRIYKHYSPDTYKQGISNIDEKQAKRNRDAMLKLVYNT